MESLAPPHQCIFALRSKIETGMSLRSSLQSYFKTENSPFSQQLWLWVHHGAEMKNVFQHTDLIKSPYRRALMNLISSGLQGHPIHQQLIDLEKEIKEASLREIDEEVRKLPIKLMVPLLLLQFPAFLVLLFGPILSELLARLGS